MKLKTLHVAISIALATSALSLVGCVTESEVASGSGLDVKFTAVELPTDSITKNAVQATPSVEINSDVQSLSYTKLMATGETNNGETFGAVKD